MNIFKRFFFPSYQTSFQFEDFFLNQIERLQIFHEMMKVLIKIFFIQDFGKTAKKKREMLFKMKIFRYFGVHLIP